MKQNLFKILSFILSTNYSLFDLALKIIINCRVSKRIKFETKQGFSRHDLILTKEQSVLKKY